MARFEQFEWNPIPGAPGMGWVEQPRICLLHTTEGSTIAGAVAAYTARKVPPHFTIDPVRQIGQQHIDTSFAARALWDVDRHGPIQTEIVGRAAETPAWPDSYYQWIAETLVKPVCETHSIPMSDNHPDGGRLHWNNSDAYGMNAPQRLNREQWDRFTGICGHQHAPPRNAHWDPGALKIDTLLRYCAAPSLEDETMMLGFYQYQGKDADGAVYTVWSDQTKRWLPGPAAFKAAQQLAAFNGQSTEIKIITSKPTMRALGPCIGAYPSTSDVWGAPRKT
jgi:hypothetical protein